MPRLLHSPERSPRAKPGSRRPAASPRSATLRALIERSARRLAAASLYYGHGTDNAHDEAAALVLHAARIRAPLSASSCRRRIGAAARARLEALLERRIRERVPAVYLTRRCW